MRALCDPASLTDAEREFCGDLDELRANCGEPDRLTRRWRVCVLRTMPPGVRSIVRSWTVATADRESAERFATRYLQDCGTIGDPEINVEVTEIT